MKTNLALGCLLTIGSLTVACSSSSNSAGPTDDSGTGADQTAGDDSGMGSDTGSSQDSGVAADTGSGSDGSTSPPAPPALGTQIDRMGRPAINTALDHVFDPNAATKGAAKDAYNADSVPSHWSTYVPEFEANLAIYDGLDTTCGNQPGYGALGNPGYATLATVLSGDALWLNTANSTCQQYLGVELAVLGVTNTDCGGRTPSENVIDLTYNIVAGTVTPGTLPGNPGPVTNGITAPASPPSSTFPYLATPH